MKIRISKEFDKSARKLSGKYKEALKNMLLEIKSAKYIDEITNCSKLTDFNNIYRIRLGKYRSFFLFEVIEQTVYLKYLINRGEAYNKEYRENLKKNDL
jgi:mRNA-degrading endonuclease RelE of RelBE toxin-antitoxin system